MSLVPVIVELPQYTQTFTVNVPLTSTVLDVKEEIARACPGNPRVDGQRLITKGRILEDSQSIDAVWTDNEARVVHLAVSPWSWSSGRPNEPQADSAPTPTERVQAASENTAQREQLTRVGQYASGLNSIAGPTPSPSPPVASPSSEPVSFSQLELLRQQNSRSYEPSPYVLHLHYKALRALSPQTPPPSRAFDESPEAKAYAITGMQIMGRAWPPIFDEEYPEPSEGGVMYEYTMVGGKPFLQNLTPHATPTARQKHALEVLTHTFPLLHFNAPTPTLVDAWRRAQEVQMLGPPLGPNVQFHRQIQIRISFRALLTPLILLALRTMLLLYFFSPARKPLFGLVLGAWVLYEAWGAVRGAFGDPNENGDRNGNGNGGRNGNGNADERGNLRVNFRLRAGADPDNRAAGNGAAAAPRARVPTRRNAAQSTTDMILARLARLNFDEERRALESPEGARPQEPSVFFKARLFVSLFVLTLHPAFWNRRRSALKEREGRLRMEANAMEREETESQTSEGDSQTQAADDRARLARERLRAQHARRPLWVREYIRRVRGGEWADE